MWEYHINTQHIIANLKNAKTSDEFKNISLNENQYYYEDIVMKLHLIENLIENTNNNFIDKKNLEENLEELEKDITSIVLDGFEKTYQNDNTLTLKEKEILDKNFENKILIFQSTMDYLKNIK